MDNPTGSGAHSSTPPDTLTDAEQRAVVARVTSRLIPLLFFCYIIAYIDRINVGFAKLHLREVLGVDASVFVSATPVGASLTTLTERVKVSL